MLKFTNVCVLIVGDAMLDRYWYGDASRISPEAPVPVVHVHKMHDVPGGAANVAANVAHLGSKVALLSVVGNDDNGQILQNLLLDCGAEPIFLRDPDLLTTVKLRIVARNQQIVRADFEGRPAHEILLPLVTSFDERVSSCGAVVFSDYGKGGLAHLRRMMTCAMQANVPIIVDPKGADYSAYRGATIITPNREEFAHVAGHWHSEADFERRAFSLLDKLELTSLLVTRSEDGMSLFSGGRHIRIPAQAHEVFDVSGAGDTVVATVATAMAAGYDIESAARLANIAAGIVIGKAGTTPISIEELQTHV